MAKESILTVPVFLRPGHPTGVYRRGGFVFNATEPTLIAEIELTDELRTDHWLIVGSAGLATTPASGEVTLTPAGEFLTRLAHVLGFEREDGDGLPTEDAIIERIQEIASPSEPLSPAIDRGQFLTRLFEAAGLEAQEDAGVATEDAIIAAITELRAAATKPKGSSSSKAKAE